METMHTGTVIELRRPEWEAPKTTAVEVLDGGDRQARYDQLLALVLRMGNWLMGPQAQLLPRPLWEEQFARYQEDLDQLHRLGDELRPMSLRDRQEPLAGDALLGEVAELLAA